MRIAIISLPLSYNYGGYLQAYALLETLRKMGHEVCFLQREDDEGFCMSKVLIKNIKKTLESIGLGFLVYEFEKKTNTGLFYKTKYFRRFVHYYIRSISPSFHSTQSLAKFCQKRDFDVYIAGSDQIWRAPYCRSVNDSFLGFAPKGTIKISYAASFGTNKWEFSSSQTAFIEQALKEFKAISVREEDGINLIKQNLNIDITPQLVLDPTFLLPKEHYLKMAESQNVRSGILTYILDKNDEKKKMIEIVCQKKNLQSFSVINPTTTTSIVRGGQGLPVEQWIAGFRDAELVLTDSFHATVFSIIFGKPFWVFENENRGNSRLMNLLKSFGCEERLISGKTVHTTNWDAAIDWSPINAIKDELVDVSMNFLRRNLQ